MYEAVEVLTDEQMAIHRMREISDSLLRTHPEKEVSFSTTPKSNEYELVYKIYDLSLIHI